MNAVITGATRGIGRAIAEAFAERGMDLAICARNKVQLNEFHTELQDKYGIKVWSMPVDMAIKKEIQDFSLMILKEWKTVDVLVNNAGIYLPGEVHSEDDGRLEQLMDVNVYGPYHLTRALIDRMISKNKGYIFNMCSVAGLIAYPNGGSYSITKFALNGFTKSLREELKDKGIAVCGLFPGATWSDSWAGVDLPEERLMQASDIAKAICLQLDLSPSAVMEDIILRPQLGDL